MQTTIQQNGRAERLARVQTALNSYLADNPTFLAMAPEQQLGFYSHALESGMRALEQGIARELAAQVGEPTRMRDVGALAGDFLDQVDFPEFVRALITGTYGSIVQSTIEQMNAYVDMYKGLAKPLASIAKEITDADALGQIASNDPMKFTMTDSGGVMDNDTGMELDRTNEEVQKMMFQAKLVLARERRLMLRETMLMGVQRLVVDKGVIKAGLIFNVKAREKGQAREKDTKIAESGGQFGGSFFGLFGGGRSGKETNISVSTRALDTDMELAAQITGHVEVQFKTDRFDLNNFANLFGTEATNAELAQRQAQGAAPGAPAGTPPLPPAGVPAR